MLETGIFSFLSINFSVPILSTLCVSLGFVRPFICLLLLEMDGRVIVSFEEYF